MADACAESETLIVKLYAPPAEGVPLIAPVAAKGQARQPPKRPMRATTNREEFRPRPSR